MTKPRLSGAAVAVLTPFNSDLAPDPVGFVKICRALLAGGAGALAVFGTTGEANSMSASERRGLLEALGTGGVPAAKLIPGVGANSITEAADNIIASIEAGCGGALMLPPFYYKGVSDEGIYAFVSEAINRAAVKGDPRIYLYHIPRMAMTGFSFDLIERLLAAFPGVVVGIKDSSGDMANTIGMLERFDNFDVFCGSENFLLETLRHGGVGCIAATCNINIADASRLAATWQADGADAQQKKLAAIREIFQADGPIPTMKRLLAHRTGNGDWARVRPPLTGVDKAAIPALEAELDALGYAPGDFYQRLT